MWKKKKRITAGAVVLLVYLTSSLFSIIYVKMGIQGRFEEYDLNNLWPTIVYCLLLTAVIIPIYEFKDDQIQKVVLSESKEGMYVCITWILIAFTLISIAMSIGSFSGLVEKSLGSVRSEFYGEIANISYTRASKSIFYYIVNMGTILSPILQLFFFYGTIYMPKQKALNVSSLVASLSNVLFSLLQASRTEAVFWLLTFIVYYVIFRSQMNFRMRYVFQRAMLIFGGAALVYIILVTVSRFGGENSANNWSTGYSIVVYMGLPYPEFCTLFNKMTFHGLTFDRVFPIITKYFLGNDFNIYEYRTSMSNSIGMPIGTFYTFLGDAMVDFGKLGMCVYTLFVVMIEKIVVKRGNPAYITLSQLILFSLIVRQPLFGIFAYVYKVVSTSLLIIGALFVAVLLYSKIIVVYVSKRKEKIEK